MQLIAYEQVRDLPHQLLEDAVRVPVCGGRDFDDAAYPDDTLDLR